MKALRARFAALRENPPDLHLPAVVVALGSLAALVLLVVFGHQTAGAAAGAIGICALAPMRGAFQPSGRGNPEDEAGGDQDAPS